MGENGRGTEGVCGLGEDGVDGGQGAVSCALIHIEVDSYYDDYTGRTSTELSKTTTSKRPQGGQSKRLFANRLAISSAHPRRRRHRTQRTSTRQARNAPPRLARHGTTPASHRNLTPKRGKHLPLPTLVPPPACLLLIISQPDVPSADQSPIPSSSHPSSSGIGPARTGRGKFVTLGG